MTKPTTRSPGGKPARKGRPPFQATDAHRRKVKALRKANMTEPEIAGALGITVPTLIKYFAAELAYVPTAADRRRVAIAAGGGMSQRDIAIALQIPVSRLKKHFANELTAGALQRRVQALEAMHAAALKGNVSACRAYLSTTLAMAQEADQQTAEPRPGATTRKGKKEQALEDAKTAAAGTDWDDLLPPHNAVLQ